MILRRLVEYADTRMELPPVMYGEKPIRWVISLDRDGKLEAFIPRGEDDKSNKRGDPMTVPKSNVNRTVNIKPTLLADNGEYVLGQEKPDAKPDKVRLRHESFFALVQRCAEETAEPSVEAVASFLRWWSSVEADDFLPPDFDPSLDLTFRVGGVFPVDSPRVKEFWARDTADPDSKMMRCLVSGEESLVQGSLPENVKGLARIGGQTSGTSLVSANARAFESYGLEGSFTSPISRDAGERFGKALNHLLADEKSSIFIGNRDSAGGTAYVFWTRRESGFDFVSFMSQPDAESVKNLLASPMTGSERSGVGANEFYALALSASGGRAVVRDWLETTVPGAENNLKRWFRAQTIVNPYGEEAQPLGLYSLAASAYRDANKEMTPQVPASLLRVAIKGAEGGQVPVDLLARAVQRNRAEGDVTRPRAALMKLVLSYGRGDHELTETAERLEKLDRERKDRAYNCGRLLAELEELQRAAIPGVKATIVDRYYGAASSTPASVFGTLMRNSTSHLGKVRKERPGVGVAIQDRIGEITTSIGSDFPNTLNMRQQAVFALGYYHQRAQNRADAKAAREARDSREES